MKTNAKIILGVAVLIVIAGSVAIVRSNAERQRVADRARQDKLEADQREQKRKEDAQTRAELQAAVELSMLECDLAVALLAQCESAQKEKSVFVTPEGKAEWAAMMQRQLMDSQVAHRNAAATLKTRRDKLSQWDAEHPQP